MNANLKKFFSALSSMIVVISVALALLLVGVRLIGLQVYTVLSGSMEPEFHTGSLIYVKSVDTAELKEKDIITFMLDEDTIATHRIVGIVPDTEDPSVIHFQTKGDANTSVDGTLVHCKNVIGTPVFSIPLLGYLSAYIQQPPGTYVAITVGAFLLLLILLPDLFSESKASETKKKPAQSKPAVYPSSTPNRTVPKTVSSGIMPARRTTQKPAPSGGTRVQRPVSQNGSSAPSTTTPRRVSAPRPASTAAPLNSKPKPSSPPKSSGKHDG